MANTIITDQSIITTSTKIVATQPTADLLLVGDLKDGVSSTQSVTYTPSQTTSIPTQGASAAVVSSFISDIRYATFMRKIDIDIVAHNLRPNRKIYVFFDDVDVSRLVQQPNEITLDTSSNFIGVGNPTLIGTNLSGVSNSNGTIIGPIDTSQETLTIAGQESRVLYQKTNSPKTILKISEVKGSDGDLAWGGNTISVLSPRTGSRGNVTSLTHRSGILRGLIYTDANGSFSTRTNVYRIDYPSLKSDFTGANSIVGKTITLLDGSNPGETILITAFDSSNSEITVSRPFTSFVAQANMVYSIGNIDPTANVAKTANGVFYDSGNPDNYTLSGLNSSNLYTDENGSFVGTLRIPDPTFNSGYRFKTGNKLLRITDSPINNPLDATTTAEFVFVASGLDITQQQIIVNNGARATVPAIPTNANANTALVAGEGFGNRIDTATGIAKSKIGAGSAPIAQTIFISETDYPRGIFVPYIDLFFSKKGTLPIELQIRPVTNGYPDSTKIIPNAVSIVNSPQVKVSAVPDSSDPNTYTRFAFPSPVYLPPNQEYALVVMTNDFDYDIYISELGERIIGTNRIVSEQPYLGSLFKSQNSRTYTAIQSEDLMFVLHKCEFVTEGSIVFTEEKNISFSRTDGKNLYDSNTVVDAFEVHSDLITLPGTIIDYSYKARSVSNNQFDTSYINFKPDRRTYIDNRKIVYGPDITANSFQMRLDFKTESKDISPIIYTNKQSLSTVEAIINNMSLDDRNVNINNPGSGYTNSNTAVRIRSSSGEGANASILVDYQKFGEGRIAGLYFDSAGYGYSDDVEIDIFSSDGANADISIETETGKFGGPALARYISKAVTLSPDFNAGDLRVYLTATKPAEANVYVYYKVRNNFDEESIDQKNWVRMVQVPGLVAFSENFEPLELEFRPSLSSNTIVYSSNTATFDTFNQFKIKIVMASSETVLTKIPYIYDMRAIALPGDE